MSSTPAVAYLTRQPPSASRSDAPAQEEPVPVRTQSRQDSHATRHTSFTHGLPTPPTSKTMTELALKTCHVTEPAHRPYHLAPYSLRHGPPPPAAVVTGPYFAAPGHRSNLAGDLETENKASPGNRIASSFQIPESVNSSRGSIAEFAAEITCLFWFESAATLKHAEDVPDLGLVDHGLVPDATPSIGFRKWVTTILTTTLVSKNVILLALLFVYRLKKFNPAVSGKRGSEFRLLTIALMLGNKFLDDNTYTNKTWAEVSGISVTEIHIMEVEFLSNMRYDLYVSEAEWTTWKAKLGKFGAFFDRASRMPSPTLRASAPVTPVAQTFPHKLPSPPSTHHSPAYFAPSPAASTGGPPSLPHPLSTVPSLPRSPARTYPPVEPGRPGRKRSLDPPGEMPLAKRVFHPELLSTFVSTVSAPTSAVAPPASELPCLPGSTPLPLETGPRVPRLPMPRVQTNVNPPFDTAQTHLAPLPLPVGRALSSVFPPTSGGWTQPLNPARGAVGSASASPSAPHYASATPARPGLSPSYFLTNRSSPYRPVRNVNTLLIPPPSTSLNNPPRNIGQHQIYYQPLSKTSTERRAGIVPYLHPDGWAKNALTPTIPPHYESHP